MDQNIKGFEIMNKFKEHDIVILTVDLNESIKAGAFGTIVSVYNNGEAFEIEFIIDGQSFVETVPGGNVK